MSSFPQDTPTYFADAETSFSDARFVIVGVPYDKTVSFRSGTRYGPEEIRRASWNFETFNMYTGMTFSDIAVHDYGDIVLPDTLKPQEVLREVTRISESIVSKKKIPIFLGGEHSISIGIIPPFPNTIKVICFDAHLDYRNSYLNNPFSHACTIRRISDIIPVDQIQMLGIRSADKEEYQHAQTSGLQYIDAFTLQNTQSQLLIEDLKRFIGKDPVYISIDIDVFDPAYAPGTGTPEPFGLSPLHLLPYIDAIAGNIIGFDIVEVCPPFDTGQSAILAAKLLRVIVERIQQFR